MSASSKGSPVDYSAMAQQFWNTVNDMKNKAAGATGKVPGMEQLLGMWSGLASGGGDQADAALGRLNQQGSAWMSMMQRLSEQLSGKSSSPADIASAWKDMLSGSAADPFSQLFRTAAGPGATGFDAMNAGSLDFQAMAQMPNLVAIMGPLLDMPAFGFAREHQERLQAMVRAHQDGEQAKQRYYALLARAGQKAYVIFERLLEQRSEPGRQISTVRGLFDLWIDAAETSYADVALTSEFREVYGELVNAQMRSRALQQQLVEQATREVGMPTRSELDGSHRKVTELQREVRRLSRRLEALEQDGAPVTRTSAAGSSESRGKASAKSPAKMPAAKGATTNKADARTATAKTPLANKASVRKVAGKKSSSRKSATPTLGKTPRAPAKSASAKPATSKSAAAKRRTRK